MKAATRASFYGEYNGAMTNSQRVGFLGGLLMCALIPFISHAANLRTGDQPSFPAGETITDDLYIAGGNVTSSGSVTGDLTAAGGSVFINGPISADVLASGGTITIVSDVAGDVRAIGGTVIISGVISGDVVIGGAQVALSGNKIEGDVLVAAGTVRLDAPVQGNVRIAGGQVTINAPIRGDVRVDSESVTLGPKANIAGSFTYGATKAVERDTGAVIQGVTTFTPREDIRGAAKLGLAAFFSFWFIARIFMTLTAALFIGIVLHRFSRELVATAATQPLLEIGRGTLFFIVLPIVSVVLLATVIGIPFGLLGLIMYAGALIGASLASPIIVGSVVHKWLWKPAGFEVSWRTILLGVAIVTVISLVPFVGPLFKVGMLLLTLGAALNIMWAVASDWR